MDPMAASNTITTVLILLAAVCAMGSTAFLAMGVYNWVAPFVVEVRDESAGGLGGALAVFVRKLGAWNRRFLWPSYEEGMRKTLVKAGEPEGYKPEDILALQEIGFIAGGIFGFIVAIGGGQSWVWGFMGFPAGAYYPILWVNDQVSKRHLAISRALPFNLDLLTLSVEAGLDFTGALAKVVEKGKHGPLRDEFALILKQLKMGKTREEALKSMVVRVDLPALTQFVMALIQADKMGTSLGKVLRIQSTQLRIERTQRAEKLAGEAPVKMLFPLVACIFPTVFMVLFGPIVFAMMYGDATNAY